MKWVKGGHDGDFSAQSARTESPHTATIDQISLYEVTMNSTGVNDIMIWAENFVRVCGWICCSISASSL